MSVTFKPTENIISSCNLAEKGIVQFLNSLENDHFGKYEFEVECLVSITHSIRIFESIIELARKDLIYVQSALILSRSLFEILIKVSWILHPPDVFENETRYVAQLNTECEFWAKCIKELDKSGDSSFKQQEIFDGISKFKNDLSMELKKKGYSIPKLPNVREALRSLDEERKYINYILLSQYTHMTHYAGNIYRENLGMHKEVNEKVSMDEWKFVFSICWPIFELATELYVYRTGNRTELYGSSFKEAIRHTFISIS